MGGAPGGGNVGAAPFANAGCHGFSYLSSDSQWRITRDALGHRSSAPTRRSRAHGGTSRSSAPA